MSLPPRSVDALFQRLLTRYGVQWMRLWDGLEPEAVKADWERVLAGMPGHRVLFALDNLPADRPPNASQFRALCMSAPTAREVLRLPKPSADPVRVAELVGRAKASQQPPHPLAWALRLLEREKAGERLPIKMREQLDRVRDRLKDQP